jgi:prophage regulatory protein
MPDGSQFPTDPWLRLPEVEREVGITSSTIYRWMAAGKFPAPKVLCGGVVRWPLSVINAWKDAQPVAQVRKQPPEPD